MAYPDFKNSEMNSFDLLIIGQGIQPLLVLVQALEKGLKVVLVSEKDCADNPFESPIQLMDLAPPIQLFKMFKQKDLTKSLTRSFLHLFISTKTESFQSMGFFEKIRIHFNKLIFKEITGIGKTDYCKIPYYSCNSNKFSISRMSISLLKTAIELGAQIHSNSNIKSLQKTGNQVYKIEIKDPDTNKICSIQSKSILRFDIENPILTNETFRIANKRKSLFYFTYPASKLKMNKNRFIKTRNQYLKIICWFDNLYFEFYHTNPIKLNIDNVIEYINTYFTDIQLDKSCIQNMGIVNKLSKKENRKQIQAVFINDKKQTAILYRPVNQWFDYSNQVCNQIIDKIKIGKKGESAIGKMVFQGSNLPVLNNPLRIMELADEKYDQAKHILKSPIYFKKLFYRYGSNIEQITEKAYENWNKTKKSQLSWLKAEIEYAIENEYCKNANDFINLTTELWMERNSKITDEINLIFKELTE